MSYLDDHLLGGERIVYRARLHWTIFLTSIVVVLLGIGLWILLQYIEPAYSYAGLGLAGIGLLLAIGPAIRYVTSEFAVTDKRVLGKVGFIERESDETLLSKIEAIAVDQGVIGRMFGFGTVTITGTGGTQESFLRNFRPARVPAADSEPDHRAGGAEGRLRAGRSIRGTPASRAGVPLLRRADPGARPGSASTAAATCHRSRGDRGAADRVDPRAGTGRRAGLRGRSPAARGCPGVCRRLAARRSRRRTAPPAVSLRPVHRRHPARTGAAEELPAGSAAGTLPVFAARLAELFRERRDVGAGQGTRSAALRLLEGVPWQESGTPAPYAGNGAAMRAGPLGLLLPDASAHVPGRGGAGPHHPPRSPLRGGVSRHRPRGGPGGSAAAPPPRANFIEDLAACAEAAESVGGGGYPGARRVGTASSDGSRAPRACQSGLDPAHMPHWQGISAFVTPSVLWSLYAFLRSPDDYWETICTAIAVGGDTDTMAAMAGAISGARLGVGRSSR